MKMYVLLNGEMVYLWRAVDHEDEVLECYVRRNGIDPPLCGYKQGAEAARPSGADRR
jgi:hypothetical protein